MVSNNTEFYKTLWGGIALLEGKQKQRLIEKFIFENEDFFYYKNEEDDYDGPFESKSEAVKALLDHISSLIKEK